MIKHSDIISKLTEAQKLRLVTDFAALGDDELNALGVPRVVSSDLDEINQKFEGRYPSFYGLANSWNIGLFNMIASDLSYRIGGEANLIDTPPMRTKSSVYVDGVSEDPHLTKAYAESMCAGIESAGASACLTDCSVREVDVAALDKNINNGVLADFLIRPFLSIGSGGNVTAIKSSPSVLRRNRSGVGEEIEKLLRRSLQSSVNIVFSGASQDTTVATMSVANELVCNTPLSALRAALGNYRRLKDEVERGTVSVSELNKAFADGVAISDEMLDAAVDKVIDFAQNCYRKRELPWRDDESLYASKLGTLYRKLESEEQNKYGDLQKFRDKTALSSVQESIVMLKNVSAMPVSHAKIAVIGELGEGIPRLDACFKKFCDENGGEYLGYSRGYMLDEERNDEAFRSAVKLAQSASTVVMFMGLGGREKSLARSSSLMLPVNQLELFDGISDLEKNVIVVLRGDFLPDMQFDDYCAGVLFCPMGGTLAAEAICSVIFGKYNPSGRLAVSGYSDVDGYHKTLRDYKVSGKNKVGQFVGYRHYTSNGTSVKYPFGFGLTFSKFEYSAAKLEGNSVTLTVRNTSKTDGREVVQLYAGKKSSALVRPTRELKGFVKVFLRAKEKKRITIPFNPADLRVYDPADGSIKVEGGKYTLYIGASCTDIRLTLDYSASGEKIQSTGDKLSDYLQSVSNITDGGYMLSGGNSKSKKSKVTAEVVPDFPYEKLFLDEFGLDVEQEEEYYEQESVTLRDDDKLTKYIGDGIAPKALCDKLIDYFADRGLAMTAPDARELISAMVASRILFVCTDKKELFEDYVNAVGTFFGGTAAVRSAVDISSDEDLFGDGAFAELLESSVLYHDSVRIAALDDVHPQELGMFFTPFIRYAANPENNRITYGNYASGEKTVTVAPNIWFAMRVSKEGACEIPAHLADISTLIMLDMARCDGEQGVAEQTGVNYYKFINAFERVEDKFELDEQAWKRIDKLTSYVNSKSPVAIGNKMWLQMEKLSAAYFAVGGDRDGALDVVVCDKLLQLFVPLLRGRLTRDDGDFSQALDNIFGDDAVSKAKSAANKLGLTVAR